MTAAFLDRIHRTLARSEAATRVALLVRNQAQCVLKYYLGGVADADENGEELLARALAPYCNTFADVGANVGNWSAFFVSVAPPNARGLLFEPSRSAIGKLQGNSALGTGCELIQCAVSDHEGVVDFYEEPGAGETSSLQPTGDRRTAEKRTVPCIRLEQCLRSRSWNELDFLKIDVEGFDLHVMRGAGDYLSKQLTGVVQFEYNSYWARSGSTLSAAQAMLEAYGYELFILRSRGLYRFDYKTYSDFFTYANFVAVSPAWSHRVASLVQGGLLVR